MRSLCPSRPASTTPRQANRACTAARVLVALAIASISGCAGNSDVERGTQRFFDDVGHGVLGDRSSHEDLLVPVSGVINVEVHNFAGNVIVRGDRSDRTTDAMVIVDRRGAHRGSRSEESEQSLPDMQWKAELVPAATPDQDPTLRITTNTTHAEPWFQRMEIEVLVGELGRVDIVSTRGKVQVVNNRGPVDINTTKGDVRVITTWPQKSDTVIMTTDGDIDFRVRGESAFTLDAESVGGLVKSRCEAGRWVATDARNDHDSMVATLNAGGARVTLRTVDGDIRVAVVGDPHAVGSFQIAP